MMKNNHNISLPRIAFLAIGHELLQGKTKDANTFWLARYLSERSHQLGLMMIISDDRDVIINTTRLLLETFDIVITSGGLGPTQDDVTKEALAQLFEKKIVFNEEAGALAFEHYQRIGKIFDPSFNKYDQLPEGFHPLPNPVGLAPGFTYQWAPNKWLIACPGVPLEFSAMLEAELPKKLISQATGTMELFVAKTWGLPEERIFKELSPTLWEELATWGAVSSLPHAMGVDIGVAISEATAEGAKHVAGQVKQIFLKSAIAPHIWQYGRLDLPEFVIQLAKEKRQTIATAESCTGGLIASRLTDVSGSSAVFRASIVAYHEEIKSALLDVPEQILESSGVVSETVAKLMSQGARDALNADISVSTTGIAGPTGGSEKKPVGTVWISVSSARSTKAFHYVFKGDREMIKFRASQAALHHLREELLLC
jgi:nicotinamide-nucleotide amidase